MIKMNDLQTAKNNLSGHTISLCKGDKYLFSNECGISPMMRFIADGVVLSGFSVADLIVGKAVAMLFVKCGISKVYAKTLSESGKEVLEKYGIPYEYETLTEKIINRSGTDICPMEKAVLYVDDVNQAYNTLKQTLNDLQNKK